ncbi:MAG TPA: protein kinase [Anaerolineae bacterium]|nr:protein kinase [Anaerolineae bacterium]HQI84637.1 protein kinase [Anaerolineae bacterium]
MMTMTTDDHSPAEVLAAALHEGENDMPPVSLEGQTLGKYRILEALGRGGMARVYRAYHPQLNRYVAVKVLRSDLLEDEAFEDEARDETWRARFQREAQSVAALRHPNIVQVYDFDVQGDVYYMVMELLEGDTLKTRLSDYRVRGEHMPWGEIVRIMLDVLDGLAYAHSERMIHRDIKPANILLSKRGQAVLADFGIAHIVGGTRYTMSGALMGTLQYMAPEQGLQGLSDARSDLYSLGIVFYEMLTQRTPFDADTPLAILMKHVNDPLPLPRRLNPDIPEPFERVVFKSLAKKPEERYQSAVDMAAALRAAAEEAGLDLPPRISLPLSFTTTESSSESVAVISGETRKVMAESRPASDLKFANDETDITLGQQRLKQAAPVTLQPATAPAPPVADTTPVVSALPTKPERKSRRYSVGRAIFNAILLVFLGNMLMLTAAVPTGNWIIYEQGWPIEVFLGTLGLCFVMYATGSLWLLPFTGPALGTAVLLTYSMLWGGWEHWNVSWVALVWIAVGSIALPFWLARRKTLARAISRILAAILGLISIVLMVALALWLAPTYFTAFISAIF